MKSRVNRIYVGVATSGVVTTAMLYGPDIVRAMHARGGHH